MAQPVGLGIWIAFGKMIDNGSVDGTIARLLDVGAKWVAPRGGVGGSRDAMWGSKRAIEFTQKCHDAGIAVIPWVYSRPSSVMQEVAIHKQLIAEGADGVIINAEDPWKGANNSHGPEATAFMQELRNAIGDAWVAHAPYSYVLWHQDFPYREFGRGVDAVLDQLYWTEFNGAGPAGHIKQAAAQWAQWNAKNPDAAKPRFPIGVTYGSELGPKWKMPKAPPGPFVASDMETFLDAFKGLPASLYTLEAADSTAIATLKERFALSKTADTDPAPPPSHPGLPDPLANPDWQPSFNAADLLAKMFPHDEPEEVS